MNCNTRIRDLRNGSKLSQKAIAAKINVAQTTYSDYETGKVRVPLQNLVALAKFYNVDMNFISGVSDQRKPFPKERSARAVG